MRLSTLLIGVAVLAMMFFPGPVGIAIASVIVGGFLLKGLEEYLKLPKTPKTTELELTNDPEFGIYNGYVCPNWDYNRIERDLGGTDLIACENPECPGCHPPKLVGDKARCEVASCYNSSRVMRGSEALCYSCNDIRDDQEKPLRGKAKREAEARKKAEDVMKSIEAAKHRTTRDSESRRVNIQGTWVTIPDGVPINAHGKWERPDLNNYDSTNFIVWTWIESLTGNRMYLRSSHPEAWNLGSQLLDNGHNVPLLRYEDTDSYEIISGDGSVFRVGDYNRPSVPRKDSGIKLAIPRGYRSDECVDCGVTGVPLDPNYCRACAKNHTYKARRKRLDKGYA